MVYLNQTQVEELDYIINESRKGFHVLFDNDTIKKYMSKDAYEVESFDDDSVVKAEKLLEEFISTPTISGRRAFFMDLDDKAKELVLRSYFSIIDNSIMNEGMLLN